MVGTSTSVFSCAASALELLPRHEAALLAAWKRVWELAQCSSSGGAVPSSRGTFPGPVPECLSRLQSPEVPAYHTTSAGVRAAVETSLIALGLLSNGDRAALRNLGKSLRGLPGDSARSTATLAEIRCSTDEQELLHRVLHALSTIATFSSAMLALRPEGKSAGEQLILVTRPLRHPPTAATSCRAFALFLADLSEDDFQVMQD